MPVNMNITIFGLGDLPIRENSMENLYLPVPRLSIKVIDDLSELEELQKILDSLEHRSTYNRAPSLERYWLVAFARVYGPSRKLAITVVLKNDNPQLVMPLQLRDEATLEFLCDETADYNDFFYDNLDGTLLKYALEYWRTKGINKIKLERLHPGSKTVELIDEISKDQNWDVAIDDCDSFAIVNVESNKDVQEWNGVHRNAIKRYIRKEKALQTIAHIKYSFVNTASQLLETFPSIQRMHINRWEEKGIYSKYHDPRRQEFILAVCQDALHADELFLPIMEIDGQLAAFIIGFRSGDTIYDWNTAFSVDYFKWSPGALLLLHVLSNHINFKISTYNLMRGLERYKFTWTNVVEKSSSVSIKFR